MDKSCFNSDIYHINETIQLETSNCSSQLIYQKDELTTDKSTPRKGRIQTQYEEKIEHTFCTAYKCEQIITLK